MSISLVKDLDGSSSDSKPLTNFGANYAELNGIFYFTANTSTGGGLWRTDGTESGTSLVKQINSSTFSLTKHLFSYGDKLYFSSNDETSGGELWISDGTEDGTKLLKDISSGSSSSNPQYFTQRGSYIYFSVGNSSSMDGALWRTDGTESGTTLVKDFGNGSTAPRGVYTNNQFLKFKNNLYFSLDDGVHGYELWKSDGTESGTTLVKDINSGIGDSSPGGFTIFGDHLYFSATHDEYGYELWRTDGTESGTTLVKDINSGTGDSSPGGFTIFGDHLYFSATNDEYGRELWRTDGTESGTILVKDINAGSEGSNLDYFTVSQNTLFLSAKDTSNGWALWKTDGTESGTELVKDINPSDSSERIYKPRSAIDYGDKLVFFANDGETGLEVWKSDGTSEGTVLVKDLNSGSSNGISSELYEESVLVHYETKEILLFQGDNGSTGMELFSLDLVYPSISGPSGISGDLATTKSINENKTEIHTFTSDENVTWSLNGGADAALFNINSSTGELAFSSAPDYESPSDNDNGNDYVVIVEASDSSGNAPYQTVTVSINDCPELNVSSHQIGTNYHLEYIKDYDGNLHANTGSVSDDLKTSYKYQGKLDVNNDSILDAIYTNKVSGRWVTGKINPSTGEIDFCDHGEGGGTRVVGIYDDPLISVGLANGGFLEDGVTPAPAQFGATGSDRYIDLNSDGDFDDDNEDRLALNSQVRFQNDLLNDNLTVKHADDYNGDGFQEVYWKTNDGDVYLRSLMHSDGNIQYANYQNQNQMSDFLTSNGYKEVISEII